VPSYLLWAISGHYRPLSDRREIGVTFNHEMPTGFAEILKSCQFNGSVRAYGDEHTKIQTVRPR
jgi:hypothetical protein